MSEGRLHAHATSMQSHAFKLLAGSAGCACRFDVMSRRLSPEATNKRQLCELHSWLRKIILPGSPIYKAA